MNMLKSHQVVVLCFIACVQIGTALIDIDQCLEKDSITCLQGYAYRQVRELSEQSSLKLGGGFELVKVISTTGTRSSGVSQDEEDISFEQEKDVKKREALLEKYVADKAQNIFTGRSLRWKMPLQDVLSGLRSSFSENVPEELSSTTVGATLAQGRAKKILKALLPLILGMKLKVVGLVVLAFLSIMFIAKKALLSSVVSIVISSALGLRALLASRHPVYKEHHIGVSAAAPVYSHPGLDISDTYSGGSSFPLHSNGLWPSPHKSASVHHHL